MTDTPERQLLREVLTNAENDVGASFDEWENLFDRIRALLDAPQPEPECVWRVRTLVPGVGWACRIESSEDDAVQIVAVLRDDSESYVERAPIGPWEVVE